MSCEQLQTKPETEGKKNLILSSTCTFLTIWEQSSLILQWKRKCHLPLHCVWWHLCGAGGRVSNLLACWVSCFNMAASSVRPLRLMASFQAGNSDRDLDRFFYLVGTIRNTKERPRLSVRCPPITAWRRRLLLLCSTLVNGDVLQPTQHRPWH